jgi:putative ABC transport system permease protein
VRPAALADLVQRDLRRSLRTFSVAALGIVAGVAVLSFFLALAEGMRAVVLGRIFPIDRVEVVPPESSVGSVLSLLGAGPPGVDEDQVTRLRAVVGVRAAQPRMRFAFPSSGRGGRAIFGRDVGAGEIPADGVDEALIRQELGDAADFRDPEGLSSGRSCVADDGCAAGEFCEFPEIPRSNAPPPAGGRCALPIPLVVSPYLVEIFNGTIAPAHNLPRVGELLIRRATGLILEWDLGRAGLGAARQGTPRRVHARLAGISRHAMDLGVTAPLSVARRLNREFAGAAASSRYSSVVVHLRDPSAMTAVSAEVRALGLEVRTSGAEQMGVLVRAITWILALASIVTVLVASLNIAHVFLSLIAERRGEIGLMRALGARRSDIAALVVLQAAALGALSALTGLAVARAAASLAERYARTEIPPFPFKPDVWFLFTRGDVVGVLVFGVAACVFASLLPAVRAARVDPAEALAGGV